MRRQDFALDSDSDKERDNDDDNDEDHSGAKENDSAQESERSSNDAKAAAAREQINKLGGLQYLSVSRSDRMSVLFCSVCLYIVCCLF